ncbi:protein N-terminal asparagine amidohydrolase [Fistulifera solaris]|uniref:Protein N-terminal asparagine amidohydrolase n=1 Tax=Fistulifera solaris TaxID=1519565 RepID=A0A1Z5J5M7_FISSO|nr:protein N-terminal asparagine amidohydrolase [Fistulifera solaris]|eukprot:GAX09290.1 protein N-terminal asparagine amidohydrolase [Fistulifera solaris]
MVIANSDSTGTLVSLESALKRVSSLEALQANRSEEVSLRQTNLRVSGDSECIDDTSEGQDVPIYLPKSGSSLDVDECLQCLPQILDARDAFLSVDPAHFSRFSRERILYVGQGEVAHAVPAQCDVIMSDKATTCHILALRSCSDDNAPLVSLSHIDSTSYEKCIRSMVVRHRNHHWRGEKKVAISVHVMGGFNDIDGTSQNISNWMIHLLADIADEERESLCLAFKTCSISCLNDSGNGSPVGRGLAIDLVSGDAFLARCDEDVSGPLPVLRSARLFTRNTAAPRLNQIHCEKSCYTIIEPFAYSPFRGMESFLKMPDDLLLQYTSTSPDCEEDSFCDSLRATLKLIRDVPYCKIFGDRCDKTLVYKRIGRSNCWTQIVL